MKPNMDGYIFFYNIIAQINSKSNSIDLYSYYGKLNYINKSLNKFHGVDELPISHMHSINFENMKEILERLKKNSYIYYQNYLFYFEIVSIYDSRIFKKYGKYIVDDNLVSTVYIKVRHRNKDINDSVSETLFLDYFCKVDDKVLIKILDELVNDLELKINGDVPIEHDKVIMSEQSASYLIHETIGHLSESDTQYCNNFISRFKNSKFNTNLNIIDFSYKYKNKLLPIAMKYDYELSKCKDVNIILNGEYNDSYYAKENNKGKESTGNVRMLIPSTNFLLRNRNLILMPHLDINLVKETKNALFIKRIIGGKVDLDGKFELLVNSSYSIQNGELEVACKDFILCGDLIQTMKRLKIIAGRMELNPLFCNKNGEKLVVTSGSPKLLFEDGFKIKYN